MSRSKITLKNDKQIALMRDAGKLVAETHAMIRDYIQPGISTGDLDRITEEYIRKHGGIPSFKGFHGFPASICVAVNDQVVHGTVDVTTCHDPHLLRRWTHVPVPGDTNDSSL